jgi:hypothetical protein
MKQNRRPAADGDSAILTRGVLPDSVAALTSVVFGRFDIETHFLDNRSADEAPDAVGLMPMSA